MWTLEETANNHRRIYSIYYLTSIFGNLKTLHNYLVSEVNTIKDTKAKIAAYQVLADYEKKHGNFVSARKYLQTGSDLLRESNLSLKNKDVFLNGTVPIDILDDLAQLYSDLGNTSKAIEVLEESLKTKTSYYGESHPVAARSSIKMAEIYFQNAQYNKAAAILKPSLDKLLYSSTFKVNPETLFSAYYLMAAIDHELGQNDDAIKNAKIARRQKYFTIGVGKNILNKSLSEDLLSRIYLEEQDYSNALDWSDKSKETFLDAYTEENNSYTKILTTKAQIFYKTGDINSSINSLEKMMDLHLEFINNNFVNLSQIEKEQFYSKIGEDLNLYFDLSIRIYEQTHDTKILESILNRRIQTKGFILNDQNKIKQAIMQGENIQLKAKLIDWQDSKEALAYYLFEDPENTSIDSLNQVINQLERTLSEQTRLLESNQQTITNKDILNKIDNNTAAVEIIRYTSEYDELVRYAAILIKPGDDYQLVLNIIKEEDEIRFSKYYKSAIQFETRDENTYKALWGNIDNALSNVRQVLLSPDGIFHQININTIPDPEGKYMIDKYQVINMTNLKDLVNEAQGNYTNTAYLFGRPQYDYTKEVASYFESDQDEMLRSSLFMELENFGNQEFADLPGTEEEVQSITGTLDQYQWATKSYTGASATEQQVKLIDNPGIIHIATHGFFLEASGNVNPMIKSGLVMAGVNNKGETLDDGVLTAYEATNLKLDNTWLVVLSACETGLGDIKNGEGVYGLQRALTVAGASNLMMTLWKVDDTATKELMIHFYDQLGKGTPLEDAFRSSQLKLREKYPNPKYWGSFILVKAKG